MAGPSRTTISAVSLPPQEAIAFFLQKTNVTSKHWTDVWQEAHSRSFMVAGAATQALVEDFRKAVQQGIEDGTTLADFRKQFDDIVGRTGWEYKGPRNWRTRVIFETNLSTAYSAGRFAQMSEPDTLRAFPFWRYVHSGARNPREQHKRWNGTVLRADDPFWKTHYPPNGWGCGCRAEPMSARDLSRSGRTQPDPSPPADLEAKKDPRSGRVAMMPAGIDPGFAYNPGEAWRGPPPVPPDAIREPPPDWPPPAPYTDGVGFLEFEGLLRQAESKAGIWSGDYPGTGTMRGGARRRPGTTIDADPASIEAVRDPRLAGRRGQLGS